MQARIRKVWGRESIVIHPPVDVGSIPQGGRNSGYLLVAARMLAYRRLDLAVSAATRIGRDLVMVGDGPEEARLREMAGPTVTFLGRVDRVTLVDLFSRCQAYLVPGIEDFGIAPVEAQAAGRPVVAFRGGGALETVAEGLTGLFFDHPTTDALVQAIEQMDATTWDAAAIRAHAQSFDAEVFRRRWRELLTSLDVDPALYRPD